MLLVASNSDREEPGIDMERFRSWAMGNLVENRNRGIFAEWLVGQALGVIADGEVRQEWDAYDLLYRKVKVEVKASGLCQTWHQDQISVPSFNIAPRRWSFDAKTGVDIPHDPPERFADVYVFCLHEPKCATDETIFEHPRYTGHSNGSEEQIHATPENVRDPEFWKFWVISKQKIDDKLGDQKSVGVGTLSDLADHVGWSEIKAEVDRLELA